MATLDEVISLGGGTRPSSSTRNKILNSKVSLKRKKNGREVTVTAVGVDGERAGCVLVFDSNHWMWESVTRFTA
jgi:hypothetical protein